MSFFRPRSVATNKTVYFDNRLYGFLKLPMRTGNLYVEKNETVARDLAVGGNLTIANDLLIGGNLNVRKNQTIGLDLAVVHDVSIGENLDVSGNLAVVHDVTIGENLDVSGNLAVVHDVTIGENLDVSGNLAVVHDVTIGENLDVSGNLVTEGDVTATNVRASGNFYLNGYVLIPYGTIIQSAAEIAPDGWFLCDGTSKLRAAYPNLFAAIGTKFGFIDALTFKLPDMQGKVAVGSGTGAGLTTRNLAESDGFETHTLSVDQMPRHTHIHNAVGGSIGLSFADGTKTVIDTDPSAVEQNVWDSPKALLIDETGSGLPHNNMQPFLVLNYLIKY